MHATHAGMRQEGNLLIRWSMLLILCAGGCAPVIIPPSNQAGKVVVYVADYGRHSSIVLPTGDGRMVEYTYGAWHYFALGHYDWYIGAAALLFSDNGALGRRYLTIPSNDRQMLWLLGANRVLHLEADQSAVSRLREELAERYARHIDPRVYNPDLDQYFVKDSHRYCLLHECNMVTAHWLEEIGCQVRGWPLLSNFAVRRDGAIDQGLKAGPSPAAPQP